MYDLQRQQALEDWNRQNQYNAPENQMRLYKQAGLNPNLIYGNGQFTKAEGVNKTNFNEQSQVAPDLGAIGESVNTYYNTRAQEQQMVINAQQLKVLEAQEKNINAKTSTELFRPEYVKALTGNTVLRTDQDRAKFATLLDGMQLTNNLIKQKTATEEAREANLGASTGYIKDKNIREDKQLASQISLNLAKEIEAQSRTSNNYEQINNLKAAQKLTMSQTFLNEMEGIMRTAGTSYSDGAVGRVMAGMPKVNAVMKLIVPGWEKMDAAQKAKHLLKYGVNQAN